MRAELELRRALERAPLVERTGPLHRLARLGYLLDRLLRTRTLGALDAIGSLREGGRFNLKARFEVACGPDRFRGEQLGP
ncbi:MAG: hypothetical protein HYU51_14380 [Candidatus Rokubacteria bacterium]|nr:hypothetical protein [Candidatus Rokubacteria bacterium]